MGLTPLRGGCWTTTLDTIVARRSGAPAAGRRGTATPLPASGLGGILPSVRHVVKDEERSTLEATGDLCGTSCPLCSASDPSSLEDCRRPWGVPLATQPRWHLR